MPVSAFGWIVLAACIHATWNLLAKRAAHIGAPFLLVSGSFSVALYLPWAAFEFWHGESSWTWQTTCAIISSGLVYLIYSLCLQRGYQVADLSIVYPVARGTGPLFATAGAVLVLDEAPSAHDLMGLITIVVGITLLASQGKWAGFRRSWTSGGIGWGVGSGLLLALYTVVDAYAIKILTIAPIILNWCGGIVRTVAILPWCITTRSQLSGAMRGYWRHAAAVGAATPLSYIIILHVLRDGAPLSIVAPVREMSMMLGALLGLLILHEPLGRWRLAGCLIMAAGVVLLGVL